MFSFLSQLKAADKERTPTSKPEPSYFVNLYNAVKNVRTINFNPLWHNGTGYFDKLVKAKLGLNPGDVVKFTDDLQRPAFVIGTRFGNVVIFKRETKPSSNVIAANAPREIEKLVMGDMDSCISKDNVAKYLGVVSFENGILTDISNIGNNTERLVKMILASTK